MYKNNFILFLLSALLVSGCVSKSYIKINNDNIELSTTTTLMSSINNFKSSLESILNETINIDAEQKFYDIIDIKDIEELSSKSGINDILSISINEKTKTFNFNINNKNYKAVKEIFPIIENDKVKTYLAEYNSDISEEEYLEMIDFVFGQEAKDDLLKSYIDITFTSDADFISYSNLSKINNNTLYLHIRLLDFILLKKDIDFSFTIQNNAVIL